MMDVVHSHCIWCWKSLLFFCSNMDSGNSWQCSPKTSLTQKKKKKSVDSFCIFCFSLSLFSCPFLYVGPDFMSSTRESHNLCNTTYTALIAITSLSTSQENSVITFQRIRVIISLWTPLNLSDYKSIVLWWAKSDCIAYLSALVLESEKPSYEY